MKEQIIYIADDGSRFDKQEACERYENILVKVNNILKPLPHKKIDSKEYFQHSADVKGIWKSLCELFIESNPSFATGFRTDGSPLTNIIARAMSESEQCFRQAQWKMATIDFETGREYERPYYVNHPNEATKQIF